MTEDYDVAVVGAGIVGTATALHLLMRGQRVLLLDRQAPGRETSYGNSGIIETSHVLPFAPPPLRRLPRILLNRDAAVHVHYRHLPRMLGWIHAFYRQSRSEPRQANGRCLRPLVARALEEHRTLMQGTDAARYLTEAGRVKLHRSEASFQASALERAVAEAMGVPFNVMDARAFQEIEPSLRPAYHKAVRWTGSARLTNPGAVTAAYADRFRREGGHFRQARVQGLTPDGEQSWRATTDQGDVTARQVVLCAGPWATDMLEPLGYRFPLGLKRGYHQHFAARDGATLRHAIVDADIGYLICPMDQGYRITTGAEFAPRDAPPTPVQLWRVLPHARELFPLGEALDATPWRGSRPCFPDSLPAIGRAPRHRGLWFNIGHGHSGLTIGPASGRLLAEMMCGTTPFCDPFPYRPERFVAK